MFDRFGLISFQAVPLERFGLKTKWKKLDKLQQEAEGLITRYQEAAAKVEVLEQGRQAARDRDLDAHADALRSGGEAPEPEHEAALDQDLAGAIRTRDALQRAVEGAMVDVTSYRLEHAFALQEDISAALDAKARKLAEYASVAAALYAEVEDGRLEARRLVPKQAAPENTSGPQDTTVLLGPMTTRTVSGPARGDIEAALSYLASLGSEAETTIVGDGEQWTGGP